jgi:ribosome biogenesis GTPase
VSDSELRAIGWSPSRAAEYEAVAEPGGAPGRVARVDRGAVLVVTERGPVRADPRPLLATAYNAEDTPTVGDWVALAPTAAGPAITAILPRRTAFRRTRDDELQVLASNMDVVFIVIAAGLSAEVTSSARHRAAIQPDGRVRRLDRELTVAHQSGAEPVVVLTKGDLVDDPARVRAIVEDAAGGVPVHLTSALDGTGVEELRDYARGDRTVVLIGASGVGKSTLSNALLGEETLAVTSTRRSDDRGRHTTVARHLLALPGGGALIDSPGIRTLGLFDADEAVAEVFADIEELAARCRFGDCAHEGEPDCAVRDAIASGSLRASRLESYRGLQREAAHQARRQSKAARADAARRQRTRSKGHRRRARERRQQRRQWE